MEQFPLYHPGILGWGGWITMTSIASDCYLESLMDNNYFFKDLEDAVEEMERNPNSNFVKTTKEIILNIHSAILSPEQVKYLLENYPGNTEE